MRIRLLQNSPDTPPGSLIPWLEAKKLPYQIDRLYDGAPVPSVDDVDWVIALGGAMNCDQEAEFPYLREEKKLLADAVARKKAVLGLCLGGQLLARALGASVRQGEGWEVGWHPVILSNATRIVTFQWHQDTFDLPEGAQQIVTGSFCANQGFIHSSCAIGLQFHPEATEEWIVACASDAHYPSGPHVQAPEQIINDIGFLPPLQKWFFSFLDQMERVARTAAARG